MENQQPAIPFFRFATTDDIRELRSHLHSRVCFLWWLDQICRSLEGEKHSLVARLVQHVGFTEYPDAVTAEIFKQAAEIHRVAHLLPHEKDLELLLEIVKEHHKSRAKSFFG